MCPFGLGSGGRRRAGICEKTQREMGNNRIKTRFDGGIHDILVSAARIKRSGRGCGACFVSNDIYSHISIFWGYLASTRCRVCWIHATLTKEVLKHDYVYLINVR